MKNTVVYLVRHAEQLKIDKNNIIEDYQTSNEKIILSINGEKEAEKISKSLELSDIDTLWSSNYVRAIATAKYISFQNNIPINIDSNFNERMLGDLVELKILGKGRKNNYTTEQLLDENLKNKDGESRKEVQDRFFSSLESVLKENINKKVVIVSHGAAIKFILLNWCSLNDKNQIVYKNKVLIEEKLELPNIIKLTFNNEKLIDIENVKCI